MTVFPEPETSWLAALEQPLAIAGTRLPNRLMMSALTLQYGVDGLLSERHMAFYEERARGGVGLLLSEQLNASPLSESPFTHALSAHDPRQIDRFRRLAAALRPYETRFFVQLFSAGAAGNSTVGLSPWTPVRGPSNIPAPGCDPPAPLAEEEIVQLVRDYGDSARNVQEGGLHGIEVHGAHGWLVGQFLSQLYNQRTDRYGGSVENRCRLALEIGREIRARVGPDFPVGLSLTYDELMGSSGITEEETLAQLQVFDRERTFDYFDLSIGSSHQQHFTIASMAVPEGFTLPFAARAKKTVRPQTAIFTSGRIVDVYQAGKAISEKQVDVIAMSRALLADAHLFSKARANNPKSITRCVGANYCVARALVDQPVACVLNPLTGRESKQTNRPRTAKALRITVLGAGPAGLRFAAVAASAGHKVLVLERREKPGGHLALLACLPSRDPWNRAIEDLTATLLNNAGELRLGIEATAETVLQGTPDLVVVATGAAWVSHHESPPRPKVLTLDAAIEAITSPSVFGRHTVIVDATGAYTPLGLADWLSQCGIRVTLVTRNESLGHIASIELDLPHVMPKLIDRGVHYLVAHEVEQIHAQDLIIKSIWGCQQQTISDVDCVVLAESRSSQNRLFHEIRALHPRVLCIGDALSPRSTAAVIHEADSLARAL